MMRRVTTAPAAEVFTCDEHEGLFTGREAWEHLQSEHPDHAATAGRLVQAIGEANAAAKPAPGRRGNRPGQRSGKRRRR